MIGFFGSRLFFCFLSHPNEERLVLVENLRRASDYSLFAGIRVRTISRQGKLTSPFDLDRGRFVARISVQRTSETLWCHSTRHRPLKTFSAPPVLQSFVRLVSACGGSLYSVLWLVTTSCGQSDYGFASELGSEGRAVARRVGGLISGLGLERDHLVMVGLRCARTGMVVH